MRGARGVPFIGLGEVQSWVGRDVLMVDVSLPRNGHYRRLQGALGRGRGRGRRGEPIPGVSGCG